MSELSERDLLAIEARAAKATPGPWIVVDGGRHDHTIDQDLGGGLVRILFDRTSWDSSLPVDTSDAKFICHARADVPALVEAVRSHDRLIDVMRTDGTAATDEARSAERAAVLREIREIRDRDLVRMAREKTLGGGSPLRESTEGEIVCDLLEAAIEARGQCVPCPVDRVREENERLRNALRDIIAFEAKSDIIASVGGTCGKIAREALEGA